MKVVTGAAGFIGSALVAKLNKIGVTDLILVDDFTSSEKNKNLEGKKFEQKIDIFGFLEWFPKHAHEVDFVFHIGANSSTVESDKSIFETYNLGYAKKIWDVCVEYSIPLVYASSAATYGDGRLGYNDSHEIVKDLIPLNLYGESKNDFDKYALKQEKTPPFWAGLKFFNVYGPNEYHKGRMASVVLHAFNQIMDSGKMNLFRSHNKDYRDGSQLRDFVYVKDVVDVCEFLMQHSNLQSGLYNVGTGKARTFQDLVLAVFKALDEKPFIEFIDIPEDIRDKYQYFTEADMKKLRSIGYQKKFTSLEEGVNDYITNYLKEHKFY